MRLRQRQISWKNRQSGDSRNIVLVIIQKVQSMKVLPIGLTA